MKDAIEYLAIVVVALVAGFWALDYSGIDDAFMSIIEQTVDTMVR